MYSERHATARTCFLTSVISQQDARQARLVIDSLRSFGGELSDCPVWVFSPSAQGFDSLSGLQNVDLIPLVIEEQLQHFLLSDKVYACAAAEAMAGPDVRSLVWINLDCLIVNPPLLFDLGGGGKAAASASYDVSFRPVHIRNVGSLAAEPVDEYWKTIYQVVGITDDLPYTIQSFVDSQTIRPYYNTHCFSVNPAKGLLSIWGESFKQLVLDDKFQAGPCHDQLHQLFLHQAVLSALVMKMVDKERIRSLPPEYSYPLHLHKNISPANQIHELNKLVCSVYEEADYLKTIQVHEPLKSWLAEHESQARLQ